MPRISLVPAVPPRSYRGSMFDWIAALDACGYVGERWYEIRVPEDVYRRVLAACDPTTADGE